MKEVTIQPTEEQKQFDFGAELTFDEPGKYIYYISEVKPKESLANIIYDQTIYRLTVNVEVDEEDDAGNEPGGQGGSDGKAEAQTGSETSDSDRMEGDSMADESNGGITGPTSPAGNDASKTGEEESPTAGAREDPCSGDGAALDVSANSSADVMRSGSEYAGEGRDGGQKPLKVAGVKIEKSTDQCQTWVEVEGNGPICAFINQYISASVPLTGTKTLEGRKYQKGDTFTFTITPEKGAPAPEDDDGQPLNKVTIEPVSGDSAEIDFGTIYFDPDDLKGAEEGTKTFIYTITEERGSIDGMTYDITPRTVQIKVTTLEGGKMKAEVVDSNSSALSWTNTWKEPDDPGDGPGDDPGDDSGDNPRPSYTSLTVNKEWILDDGGEAPVSVTVELLRNNRVHEKVTLDEDNDWSHTWTRLDDRYNWKVQEADVPDGFTAEVSHHGTIWTITNDDIPEDPETPPEEPDEPDEPDTPEDPVTPDEPDVPDTPDTPDEPNTPNEPTLPQTGQNWRLVWILAITGAVLVLVGILGKKGYHGKHEA